MKITVIIPVLLGAGLLFMTACNREELAASKQDNDSLMTVLQEQESTLNGFIASFNEVERNLDSVAAKQQVILLHTGKLHGELKPNQADRINAEIESINAMMDQNRKTIEELRRKLKKSSDKNIHLEKTIATLNHQLAQKYLELTTLNDQLGQLSMQVAKLQTSVDTLTQETLVQAQTISEKNTELHTAYYIIGKSKELQEAKLIDKQGGLLGIGRTATLSPNLDTRKFIRIDYTQTSNIAIASSNVKIITSHPSDSYTLSKNGKMDETNLMISNPEKFWSASKYLVIVNN